MYLMAHAGSIDVIVWPFDERTNSLLMNSPVGCVYLLPFGASSSTESDMIAAGINFDSIQMNPRKDELTKWEE
jgi:hypothetical protein